MKILISIFFHIILTIFIYEKLLPNAKPRFSPFMRFAPLLIIYIFSVVTQLNTPLIFSLTFIASISIYTTAIYNTRFDLSLITTIFSHCIFRLICNISTFLITILCIPIYYKQPILPNEFLVFFTGLLSYLFLYLLFKIKRLKSGMPFLSNTNTVNIGILICIVSIAFKTIDISFVNKSDFLSALLFRLTIFLLAIILFTWWRKQITKSYIEKLRKLEVQSLYEELAEKEKTLKKLTADNEALSRLIHKDNKIIPAMENSVIDYLSGIGFHTSEEQKQYGQELILKLKNMTHDRQGILESYENENHKLHLTGHVEIDAILVYMKKKADAKSIMFECRHTPESLHSLLSKISEEDLSHLLSDLIENALIAVNNQEHGRIQVTFGQLQKECYIAVADTGAYFDTETLQAFGLQPHTTHKDEGGSGIGLMDIWNLKRKHRATIQVQEYERSANNFTKKIFFSFNSKNHYVIQSFRHNEISNAQTRGDLYVIPTDIIQPKEEI